MPSLRESLLAWKNAVDAGITAEQRTSPIYLIDYGTDDKQYKPGDTVEVTFSYDKLDAIIPCDKVGKEDNSV